MTLPEPVREALEGEVAKLVVYRLRNMVQGGPLAYDAIAIDEAADHIATLTAERDALAQRCAAAERDAGRWQAVIGSARVRVLGSAGLNSELDPYGKPWNGYAHIGVELWTKHEGGHEPPHAVEWLTKYADAAIHQETRHAG